MPTYRRQTRVRAPFDEVWEFHSGVAGLEALTPAFMNLRVDDVVGPDDERDPEVLETGSRIHASVRPFGVGPRQRWVSVIVEREEGDGVAYFVDEMEDGPFPHWRHTHRFYADGEETVVEDEVEYELPVVGTVGPLGDVGFEPMFRYRHRRTRELLEG
ncbi:SRPBCC family protein [Halomarina oriensis]|uniref:Cyclase n=1 Tax=Halomarina oriensis TaxID=671145 RepID=A0A6B0GV12_9EURY|nr:SRPBCC family protein [Halomarina oriensis]MWG36413.1 cyclase [Halomarina oriensis]